MVKLKNNHKFENKNGCSANERLLETTKWPTKLTMYVNSLLEMCYFWLRS